MRDLIQALNPSAAFEPETVEIMAAALERACASLQASGAPSAAAGYAERTRAILARHIIQAAVNGERDPRRLSEGALLRLANSGLRRTHQPAANGLRRAMPTMDLAGKVEECARALAATSDPTKREALSILQSLWINLTREARFLGDGVLADEIAKIDRIHAELTKPGAH